jgi:hypothetical protein
MPANNRIFYATQAVQLKPQNSDGTAVYANWLAPKGLQSVGMTTTFNLEQLFELGQIEVYDQVEETPDVQVTLNKVIDGTMPLYLICMGGSALSAGGAELANIANNRVNFRLGVFSDSSTAATGAPSHYVDCSGMYLSAFTYTFPVDGNATEEITLVGNNKLWNSGVLGAPGSNATSFGFTGSGESPSTIRRYNVNYANTVLPTGTGTGGGYIKIPTGRTNGRPYVQSVTIASTLGREAIREFGAFAPYYRYVNFPVEVTSEFQVVASDGDYAEANDFASNAGTCGTSYKNVSDKQVVLTVCGDSATDTLTLDLGTKNKLTSVNYTGGDTGGGNATITYSYRTFNKFVVRASGTFASTAWLDTSDDAGLTD